MGFGTGGLFSRNVFSVLLLLFGDDSILIVIAGVAFPLGVGSGDGIGDFDLDFEIGDYCLVRVFDLCLEVKSAEPFLDERRFRS